MSDLTDAQCVMRAIEECDSIGREQFLKKYGFGRSTKFMVDFDGQLYDSKALVSAAHQLQTGDPLPHTDFSGGKETTVKKLEELGFKVLEIGVNLLSREDVEATLNKFDAIGRDAFLAEYGGREASKFFLEARGKRYDAKAILVVALRRLAAHKDTAYRDVESTMSAVAGPLLRLGYKVVGDAVQRTRGNSMNEISDLIERILEHQTKYNASVNDPVMVERRAALEDLDRRLVAACGPTFSWPGGSTWTLAGDVSLGAGYAPKVAWARLTDRSKSPSATAGWYVVLLFAADGSSCVVSLNQGTTSVTGADKNRMIKEKAHNAFSFLDDSSADGPGRGWAPFGGVPHERLAAEPELRGGALGRSYELGHVDGVVYERGNVPSDDVIVGHAKALLGMLGRLYDSGDPVAGRHDVVHLLLRGADSQSGGRDTIREHRDVLAVRGQVVWAKFGKPLADSRVEDLNVQINSGATTHAYLLGGSSNRMYRARVDRISQGTGGLDRENIPAYYRDSLEGSETCFTLGQIEDVDLFPQIDDLIYMASNPEKKMTEALVSQTSVFFVKEKNGVVPMPTPEVGRTLNSKLQQAADTLNMTEDEVRRLLAGVQGTKRQMILMGPPGTGKTFVARELAKLMVHDADDIRLVQFHPSYGYEDFIEGLRPVADTGGRFEFKRVPGVLVQLAEAICGDGESEGDGRPRVLIIDEINRANISRVFGELMFLLEYRDQPMKLMLDNREFKLPDELIIIGTMNTADRSIRTLDVAMRRRFRFFELAPRGDVVTRQYAKSGWNNVLGAELVNGLERLNAKLTEDIDRHHTIGHSYLLVRHMDAKVLVDVWDQEILPLIEDFFFDRPDKVEEYRFEEFWPGV